MTINFRNICILLFLYSVVIGKISAEEISGAQPLDAETNASVSRDISSSQLVDAQNLFSLDIYQKLKKENENLFISPFSIWSLLSMANSGAAGETQIEMENVLRLPHDVEIGEKVGKISVGLKETADKNKLDFSIANALFNEEKPFVELQSIFLDNSIKNYGSEYFNFSPTRSPSQAAKKVNKWVDKQTKGNIKEIITPDAFFSDDPENTANLILLNAIYFYGDWRKSFREKATQDEKFYTSENESKLLPLMTQQDNFLYYEDDSFQAVSMPYGKEENNATFSMLVMLPREKNGLEEFSNSLTMDVIKECHSKLKKSLVKLYLPRFDLKESYVLNDVLIELGMESAFIKEDADFSNMFKFKDIGQEENYAYVKEVIHKSGIEMSEKGTKAYAATMTHFAVGSVFGVVPPRPIIFRADHPFVFLIRDDSTGSILFMGQFVG